MYLISHRATGLRSPIIHVNKSSCHSSAISLRIPVDVKLKAEINSVLSVNSRFMAIKHSYHVN